MSIELMGDVGLEEAVLPEGSSKILDEKQSFSNKSFSNKSFSKNSFNIEEYWSSIDQLENDYNISFVRMDFGLPGIPPSKFCIEEHCNALKNGTTAINYPPYSGDPELRKQFSIFLANKLAIECDKNDVVVTCGATQALFVAQYIAAKCNGNGRILFLTPTYPPMVEQCKLLGLQALTLEVGNNRGAGLVDEISAIFEREKIDAICWASPNNPSWVVLDETELQGIAEVCKRHEAIAIEDLTYLGMTDVKMNDGEVFPSISQYYDRYFLVLSASKMLSYAGERLGFLTGSRALMDANVQTNSDVEGGGEGNVRRFSRSLVFNLSAGSPYSAQSGIREIFKLENNGTISLKEILSEYVDRAKRLRGMLSRSGFYEIYDNENPDGFYVCFGYPNMGGEELCNVLIEYNISVLPLTVFLSKRTDGVRACVGRLSEAKFQELELALENFSGDRNNVKCSSKH